MTFGYRAWNLFVYMAQKTNK